MEEIYRFRSVENLLGKYKELETQTIYFATPSQLNDPIEGFRNIFWQGDNVIWNNLLKHYINQLSLAVSLISVMGEDGSDVDFDLIGTNAYTYTSVPKARQRTDSVYKALKENASITRLINFLGGLNRKIYKEELGFILKILHPHVLNEILIFDGGAQNTILEGLSERINEASGFNLWEQLEAIDGKDESFSYDLFHIASKIDHEQRIIFQA